MVKQVNTKQDILNFIETELSKGEIETFILMSGSGTLFHWDFENKRYIKVPAGTAEQPNPYFKGHTEEEKLEEEESIDEDVVEESPVEVETPVTEAPVVEEAPAAPVVEETPAAEEVVNTVPEVTEDDKDEIIHQYKLRLAESEENNLKAIAAKDDEIRRFVETSRADNASLKGQIETLTEERDAALAKVSELSAASATVVDLASVDIRDLCAEIAKRGWKVSITFVE